MGQQRVGPTVKVKIEYQCNGCQFHKVDGDEGSGMKYHACHHPAVLEEYSCAQYVGGGREGITIYHEALAPPWLCPYIKDLR